MFLVFRFQGSKLRKKREKTRKKQRLIYNKVYFRQTGRYIQMAFLLVQNRSCSMPLYFFLKAVCPASGIVLAEDFCRKLHIPNVDVYVTGSNAKLLLKGMMTELRERRRQIINGI